MREDDKKRICSELGLSDADELIEIVSRPLTRVDIHRGLAAVEPDNWARESRAIWNEAEFEEICAVSDDLRFYRSSRADVLFFTGDRPPAPASGSETVSWEQDGPHITAWRLFPGPQMSLMRISTPDSDVAVAVQDSQLQIFRIRSAWRGNFPPADGLGWLRDHPGEPWMESEVRRILSSADPCAPPLAAGFLSRFWIPADAEGRQALAMSLARGEPNPAGRFIGEYAAQLEESHWQNLDAEFSSRVRSLQRHLETLEDDLFDGTDSERMEHADGLRLHRDDLESLKRIFQAGGRALPAAAGDLQKVDLEAERKLFLLSDAGSCLPERLLAANWMIPDAWWSVCPP